MKQTIFELLEATILSRALFTAAELNIAELLEAGPQSLEYVAKNTQTDKQTLERLLHFLTLKEIFSLEADGQYSLRTESKILLGNHKESIKPFLLHDDETRWNSFGHLTYSIQTGKPAFDMLYSKDYFSSLKQSPLLSQRFDDAMNIISRNEDIAIANNIKLSGEIADIGGGNGQLLSEIIKNQPSVTKATLFDLPNVVEAVQTNEKLQKIGGSFFEPLRLSADTLILKRVLHDWNDTDSIAILKNIVAIMNNDTQLWIIDGILDMAEQKTCLAAIDLALLTIFGGKERSLKNFESILTPNNLVIEKTTSITPLLSGILCKKKVL